MRHSAQQHVINSGRLVQHRWWGARACRKLGACTVQIRASKAAAVRHCHYEEAAVLHSWEEQLKAQLVGPASDAAPIARVDTPDIEAVVAAWSGVPVERLTESDVQRLIALPAYLSQRVVGQPAAVAAISRALQRAGCGLREPGRPIASLLFAGPTGVGKTCLTNELAAHLFSSKEAVIRLDMSEYMERHTVSKLVGPPPGYVGYSKGGTLTEAVQRTPHSVVLFDEIEKAHPDVLNILLQVMEDGRLCDSQGRVVTFSDCLVVLTSNVGSHVISKGGHRRIGFQLEHASGVAAGGARRKSSGNAGGDEMKSTAMVHEDANVRVLVLEELRAVFRPEFVNRLDEIVVFNPLRAGSVRAIVLKMLDEVADRVRSRDVLIDFTSAAVGRVCAEGMDIASGARKLRRAVTTLVEDPLSDYMLSHDCWGDRRAQELVVDWDGAAMVVQAKQPAPETLDAAKEETVVPRDWSLAGWIAQGLPFALEVEAPRIVHRVPADV